MTYFKTLIDFIGDIAVEEQPFLEDLLGRSISFRYQYDWFVDSLKSHGPLCFAKHSNRHCVQNPTSSNTPF